MAIMSETQRTYEKARDRGVGHKTAFIYAVDSTYGSKFRKVDNSHNSLAQEHATKQMHDIYNECRDRGDPHAEAWERCDRFAKDRLRNMKRGDTCRPRDRFDDFDRAWEAMDGLNLNDGHLFYDSHMRRESRDYGRSTFINVNFSNGGAHITEEQFFNGHSAYKTEYREPTGNWMPGSRPAPNRGPSHAHFEKSHPFKNPSYNTEMRFPGGGSASNFARSSSTRGQKDRPHRPYNTEERRPRESSREHSTREPSPPSRSRAHPPAPAASKPTLDLYAVLGVSRRASASKIKTAYRKQSMKWHPDRVSSADKSQSTCKMQEINQAYEVLGNEDARVKYDDSF